MLDHTQLRQFIVGKITNRLVQLDIESSSLSDSFDLMGSGAIDSMEFINLLGEIEMAFDIDLDFSEYDPSEFTTLGGLMGCVSRGVAVDST